METDQALLIDQDLRFIDIIKESIKLILSNPKFIILTSLSSFPLFSFLLFLQLNLQQSSPQILDFISTTYTAGSLHPGFIVQLVKHLHLPFLLQGFLYLAIYHSLDLINTVATIHWASSIYAAESPTLSNPFKNSSSITGPLITSVYSLILTSLTLIGIASLLAHLIMSITLTFLLAAMFFVGQIALVVKLVEWSGIWNLGMVMSVLEEKHGVVAIGVSAYVSRGNRGSGFLIMLTFVVWVVGLKFVWLFGLLGKSGIWDLGFVIGEVWLVCLANLVKWVSFTIYYYDCKRRFLHKKVDVEQVTQV